MQNISREEFERALNRVENYSNNYELIGRAVTAHPGNPAAARLQIRADMARQEAMHPRNRAERHVYEAVAAQLEREIKAIEEK